ncbi:MAG: hypothetical protein OEX12_13765 [Gammaproteobacteria bacterium]|nr:hypothetical protein [Gammaproteobacteria bacterium]
MTNSDDEVRDKILQYFYQIHADGTGTFNGRERGDVAVRELAMQTEFDRVAISRNIEYLVANNLINHIIKNESAQDGSNIKLTKHSYEISDEGLNKILAGQ